MPAAPPRSTRPVPTGAAAPAPRRWLLLVHQLPTSPSNLRVRTWRRLQQLGAVPLKQAVYALPDSASAREDFEWLTTEIKALGGDATVFSADTVDNWSDDALIEEFRRARQEDFAALATEIDQVLRRLTTARRSRGRRAPAVERLAGTFCQRLTALDHIDFFGSAGGDRARLLLAELESHIRPSPGRVASPASEGPADRAAFQARLWVTRPRPGVDRMASAWLIRRFIDPGARFAFAPDRGTLPAGDPVPFDMFGVEFSHQAEGCTFETLCTVFGVQDPAVARIATIVHDLDLKDGRFGAVDAPTIGSVIDGLQLAHRDDDELLERGMTLFESLYRAFAESARAARPRAVANRPSRTDTRTPSARPQPRRQKPS
jgi:hypothetical protein